MPLLPLVRRFVPTHTALQLVNDSGIVLVLADNEAVVGTVCNSERGDRRTMEVVAAK